MFKTDLTKNKHRGLYRFVDLIKRFSLDSFDRIGFDLVCLENKRLSRFFFFKQKLPRYFTACWTLLSSIVAELSRHYQVSFDSLLQLTPIDRYLGPATRN